MKNELPLILGGCGHSEKEVGDSAFITGVCLFVCAVPLFILLFI